MARRKTLNVWLHGIGVGAISTNGRPGNLDFRYSEEALDRWSGGQPVLSCAFPLSNGRYDANAWFRGLLPEGRAREAMVAAANVAAYDTFALLQRYGRDVAGAVVVSDEDPAGRPGSVDYYTRAGLDADVGGLESRPLALYDDSELSLAGLQNKLLLVKGATGWGRPVGGAPSTHILKTEDRRYPGLARMEVACLHLAKMVGLTTVQADVEVYSNIECVVVSRYDRQVDDQTGTVARVHQEDLCQATGRDPDAARGRGKYQAHGGPGFADVSQLLDRYAVDPIAELHRLARIVAFTLAIGNADAHGKNLSLLLAPDGTIELAPLYDTVPTVMWPQLRSAAAMTVGGRADLDRMTLEDLESELRSWLIQPSSIVEAVTGTLADLVKAAETMEIPDQLAELVTARCQRLLG